MSTPEAGTQIGSEALRVLIVDDEAVFARAVDRRLSKVGYACSIAATLREARQALEDREPHLVLLDMRLPDGSGLDLLGELRRRNGSEVPVIVVTAYGEVEDAVAAMKLQAADYLKKPVDLEELLLCIDKVLARTALGRALEYSHAREQHAREGVELLGEDPAMVALREQARRLGALCRDRKLLPPTILILGETGTGKDLLARLLHHHSARAGRPFVHVDCAALPKDLIEAELFGHEKGAFTSATAPRTGLIEAAEDGVVFLDEVAEIPLALQAKLLAVLERRSLRRIGSTRERPVAAWFIAATHREPERMLAEGQLRPDLYFRLNVLTIRIPPLHQRGRDAVLLATRFAEQTAKRYGFAPVGLAPEACAAIIEYRWPGNVRELKHVIERALLLSGTGTIDREALMLPRAGESSTGAPEDALAGLTLAEAERLLLTQALKRSDYNVSEAARQLGLTRMAMRYRMQKHGL